VKLRTPFFWISLVGSYLWLFIVFGVKLIDGDFGDGNTAFGWVVIVVGLLLGSRVGLTNVRVDKDGVRRLGPLLGKEWAWKDIEDFEIVRDSLTGWIAFALVRLHSGRTARLGVAKFGKNRADLQQMIAGLRQFARRVGRPD
jgi:hypothetical protein